MGTINCDALRQFQQYAANANADQAVQISGVGLRAGKNETSKRDDVVTLSDRNITLKDGHDLQNAQYTAGAFRRALHLGTSDTKFANNAARTLFLNAVLKECGKTRAEDLDDTIKKELKLGAFGAKEQDGGYKATSGKPLTARRINAVLTAVEEWKKTQPGVTEKTSDDVTEIATEEVEAPKTEVAVDDVKTESADETQETPRNTPELIKADLAKMQESFKALEDSNEALSKATKNYGGVTAPWLKYELDSEGLVDASEEGCPIQEVESFCEDMAKAIDNLKRTTEKRVRLLLESGQPDEARKRLDQSQKLVAMMQAVYNDAKADVIGSLEKLKEFPLDAVGGEDGNGDIDNETGAKIDECFDAIRRQKERLPARGIRLVELVAVFWKLDADVVPEKLTNDFLQSQAFKNFVQANGLDESKVKLASDIIARQDESWKSKFVSSFDDACNADFEDSIDPTEFMLSPASANSSRTAQYVINALHTRPAHGDLPEAEKAMADELTKLHMQHLMMNGLPMSEIYDDDEVKARALLKMGGIKLDGAYYNDTYFDAVRVGVVKGAFEDVGPVADEETFRSKVRDVLEKINWPVKLVDYSETQVLLKGESVEKVTFSETPSVNAARRFAADLVCSERLEYACLKRAEAERFHRVMIDNQDFARQLVAEAAAYLESQSKDIDRVFGEMANDETGAFIDKCPSAAGLDKTTKQVLQKFLQRMLSCSYSWIAKSDEEYKALWRRNDMTPQGVRDAFEYFVATSFDKLTSRQLEFLEDSTKGYARFSAGAGKEIQEEFKKSIDELFPATNNEAFNPEAGSLEKIISSGPDHDIELVKNALKRYFEESDVLDQSQLLATLLRTGGLALTGDARTAAILKSTGPVMLKMLQGLDTSRLGDRMKKMLDDLKDHLYDIPQYQVKAYLGDAIARSNGAISNIEVITALGAASVGQTFLCNVTGSNGETQLCAVKILRPGAKVRAYREREVLGKIAGDMGEGMRATFSGKVDSIMREFDLVHEGENIDKGRKVYASSVTGLPNVDSVERADGVVSSDHVMSMKAVKKDTFKRKLADMTAEIEGTSDPVKLRQMREEIVRNHRALEELAKLWVTKAIFTEGGGIYHGDLHSGNIMVDENGKATMIDFGNVTELTDDESKAFLHLIAGAASGNSLSTGGVIFAIKSLLSAESAEKLQKRLDDERAMKAEGKMAKTLEDHIQHIISLGTGQDVGLRVTAVLKLLKSEGLEVPPAIHNFNESQVRLNEVLNLSKKALESIDAKLGGAPKDEEPLHSLVECVGDVVKANVDFTIARVGTVNGMSFAGGFLRNGLITNAQYNEIVKSSASNAFDSFKNTASSKFDSFTSYLSSYFKA